LGEGQFLPLVGSEPYVGDQLNLEKVIEYKVELVCDDHLINEVMIAFKKSHPYEEPAYQVWKLEMF
jgi:hypothetical protein